MSRTDGPKGEGLRDRKKRETRASLTGAAVRLADEKGLDNVTVDDIAAAAGVSTRTFFNYFPSKEDAVAAPDTAAGPRIAARLAEAPPGTPVLAALRAALLADLAEHMTDDLELWLVRMRVVKEHPSLLAKVFAGGQETEQHMVDAVAARLGVPATATEPMLLVAASVAAFRVALVRWATMPDPPALAELFGGAMDFLADGLSSAGDTQEGER